MNKKYHALWASTIVAISLSLSGCQLLTGYQKIDEAQNADAWMGKIQPMADEVNIACSGTYHCEIVQIDKTLVIAPDSHKPVNPSMVEVWPNNPDEKYTTNASIQMMPLAHKNAIKVVPLTASSMPGLVNYYARVKPAKREVHVNFYPENNMGYVERFAMIHDFDKAGIYQLRAYQKKASEKSASLLETASPEPLCIELLLDNKMQRRFCKQLGVDHQGEFVETQMVNATSLTSNSKKARVPAA